MTMKITKMYRTFLAAGLLILAGCSGGGGSDAASIAASINGNHAVVITYVRPGDMDVEIQGTMVLTQSASGALSGNISLVSDNTQPERCYRGGNIISASSQVTGTTFTLTWDDIRGDQITINGSIVGRSLDGTFVATDTDAGNDPNNGCSGRSGQFTSTF